MWVCAHRIPRVVLPMDKYQASIRIHKFTHKHTHVFLLRDSVENATAEWVRTQANQVRRVESGWLVISFQRLILRVVYCVRALEVVLCNSHTHTYYARTPFTLSICIMTLAWPTNLRLLPVRANAKIIALGFSHVKHCKQQRLRGRQKPRHKLERHCQRKAFANVCGAKICCAHYYTKFVVPIWVQIDK